MANTKENKIHMSKPAPKPAFEDGPFETHGASEQGVIVKNTKSGEVRYMTVEAFERLRDA